MTGQLENTNCAYYPDYNVGCGVSDPRDTSFGVGFNEAGGGVYAMQWTSESILIWNWARADVPEDVDGKTPDPSSWGLPVAQLGVGNCSVDQHFQNHKIIFDTTFCGEYAGNPYVWQTNDDKSCQAYTGAATCNQYVANNPEAFKDAYWSVNYVRVYQLEDPAGSETVPSYIASEQASMVVTSAALPVATPNLSTDTLCPKYNFSIITDGKYQYEIACDFDPPGPDYIGMPHIGFKVNSLADCIAGCTYLNEHNGTNSCGGVAHSSIDNYCYFKRYIDGAPKYRKGFNEVRLIYYGYPQITDDPRSTADSTLTSVFVESIPTPQTYRPSTSVTSTTVMSTSSQSSTTTVDISLPPAMGNNATKTSTVPNDYSDTVTLSSTTITSTSVSNSGSSISSSVTTSVSSSTASQPGSDSNTFSSATTTTSSPATTISSTDPSVTKADFYIVFDVDEMRRLSKRAIRYLSFDGQGQSALVASEGEATKFHLAEDESLMAGDQYVAVDASTSVLLLRLSNQKPAYPIRLNVDDNASVSVEGIDDYCLTTSGALAVILTGGGIPKGCQLVEPELLAAAVTTTTSMSTSRTGSSLDTATSSRSSTSSTPTATPPKVNDFVYAGCFGIPAKINPAALPGLSIPLTSDSMTNAKCIAACKVIKAYYAATHEDQCLCSTSPDLYSRLLNYPDTSCNIPCPGSNRDFCGGNVLIDASSSNSRRRQNTEITLVSLYNNTLLLSKPGQPDGSTTTPPPTTSNNGTFPTDSVSYNVTGTNTATVISTTYIDVCPACPGGLTTKSTTITVPHCGCTASYDSHLHTTVAVPSPAVPMFMTVKSCNCGHNGAWSTVTVTIPHTSSISQLAASAAQRLPNQNPAVASQAANRPATNAAAPAAAPAGPEAANAASNEVIPVVIGTPNDSLAAPAPATPAGNIDLVTTPTAAPNSVSNRPAQAGSQGPASIAAAPASPPSIAANSATNGNGSAPTMSGNSTTPYSPIQSFTSLASRFGGGLWGDGRFVYSLGVSLLAVGIVGVW